MKMDKWYLQKYTYNPSNSYNYESRTWNQDCIFCSCSKRLP